MERGLGGEVNYSDLPLQCDSDRTTLGSALRALLCTFFGVARSRAVCSTFQEAFCIVVVAFVIVIGACHHRGRHKRDHAEQSHRGEKFLHHSHSLCKGEKRIAELQHRGE